MENSQNCSILVTSCDKYEDAWIPFFTLFDIMWPTCTYPIYLNTESQNFVFEKMNIQSLHPKKLINTKNQPISWSCRLTQVINQIDSKYILFFLEDFFLMSPVREDMVEKCLKWMEKDSTIGVIDFFPERHEKALINEEFSLIDSRYDYCINTMAALWRKDFLLQILRDENPWDFEFFGTERWRRTNYKIFTHRAEFPPIFDYKIDPALGYGIFQGKWLKKNVELFEKYNIDVDFSKRGFTDPPNMKARKREKNWLLHDFKKIFNNPRLIGHYIKCSINVLKDKIRRFRAKYLNH